MLLPLYYFVTASVFYRCFAALVFFVAALQLCCLVILFVALLFYVIALFFSCCLFFRGFYFRYCRVLLSPLRIFVATLHHYFVTKAEGS